MDIHPPHAIHSWKDFLLQLGTITAGILIALSLEGIRESFHDRALVREARENIRREIADNQKELDGELRGMPTQQQHLDGALTFANEMMAGGHSAIGSLEINVSNATLRNASWQTADRTGALAHMDYGEVQKYASAYAAQDLYAMIQRRMFDQVASALAIMSAGDPTKASRGDIEVFRRQLLELRGEVYILEQLGKSVSEGYRKALE
ncbi:MAG TPA: hypothetical protein VKE51_09490 [Vicinamibacterales bacterium]|nr:hypothetical protein [Vicinamibacterales bacterium]